MNITINPVSSSNTVGHGIIKPDTYGTKPAAAVIFVHGNAGVGNGSQSGVQMVLDTQVPATLKEAVDKYNLVVLFPQYSNSTDIGCLDKMIQEARALPGVDISRVYFMCFSRGGELVTRFMSASASRAALVAGCVNIGALNVIDRPEEAQYIVSEKVPMVFFHASNDPAASVNNTKTAVATINAAGATIPAKAVYYNSNQHDIVNEVCSVDVFPFRGTETVNNIYEWMLLNSRDKPIGVPETGGVVKPIAVAEDIITTTGKIALIGNKSRNYVASKCKWKCVKVPGGVNIWNINACADINCGLSQVTPLPTEGEYVFELTVMDAAGQTDTKQITVTYSKDGVVDPPVKELDYIDTITHMVYFKDGTHWTAVTGKYDPITKMTTYKSATGESIAF